MKYSDKQYLQDLTKNQQLDIMNVDFFSNKKLNVIKESNAFILPPYAGKHDDGAWFVGGVLDNNKKYIEESGLYAYGEKTRIYGQYDFDENKVEYIDKEVVYFNYCLIQWGHYLIEVIGRLWYILKHPDCYVVYTGTLNGRNLMQGNFLQLLNLLGINNDRLIFINKVTKFKKVIVPETSVLITKYWTKEYKTIIDKLVENALSGYKLKKDRKVYCSRRHFAEAKEIGEENIEKVFEKNGYEIVYMEELNLIDQIRLLNECKKIACISGTLVHNAMLIRNTNCEFIVLNKTYKINQNIYLTNQISEANFTFVDIYISPLPISIGKGPFIVSTTKEFRKFCDNNELTIRDGNRLSAYFIFKYYISYLFKYRNKIINGNNISDSGFKQYDVTYKQLRNHYKKTFDRNKNVIKNKTSNKILLVNQGNSKNVGDIIINKVLVELLKKRYYVENLPFTAKIKVGNNKTVEAKTGIFLKIKKRVSKLFIFNWYHVKKKKDSIKKLVSDNKYDYVIIGGGELIKSKHEFFIELLAWTDFFKNTGTKLILFGISCDRNYTLFENIKLKQCLNKYYYINTRDIYSKKYLEDKFGLIVSNCPDVGFIYNQVFPIHNFSKSNVLLISVYNFKELIGQENAFLKFQDVDKYYLYWEKLVLDNYKKFTAIKGIANTESDLIETNLFIRWFNKRNAIKIIECGSVDIKLDYEKVIYEIAKSKAIITGRMHAMIIANQYKTFVIPFIFKDKIKDYVSTYIGNDGIDYAGYEKIIKKELYNSLNY